MQKPVERKGFTSVYSFSHHEVKAGQELEQRPWRRAADWLVFHDLLSLLSYTTSDHLLRDGTTHKELSFPLQLLIKKNIPTD